MALSIPASKFVNIAPGVITAGGLALALSGLILTNSTRPPIGTVLTFSNATAVSTYFGLGSTEAALASIYFLGFDNSQQKPGALLFAQYPSAAVSGYTRGGPGITLALAQAITSGTMTVTVDGTPKTSSAINLSAATSLSNAATLITAAFTTPGFVVTFDSTSGAFVITSSTTGATSTIAVTTGTVATALFLTAATGAVVSPGAAAAVAATFMNGVIASTQNFVSFMTVFEPNTNDCVSLSQWTNGQANRYRYVCWDTDATVATTVPATASVGYLISQAAYSGTALVYTPTLQALAAAFALSIPACLDTGATNGRATSAYKSQIGLAPDIVDVTTYSNMVANGYNGYVAAATANQPFNFYSPGSISGLFLWDDSYVNQVYLNNALQLALMSLLTNVRSIPYNTAGYALIDAACNDPITQALNFGAIRPGVVLSALQIAEINAAAGQAVADIVSTRGWYLSIQPASPQVRAARGSPPITLFYADGQSIQTINLSSLEVQ